MEQTLLSRCHSAEEVSPHRDSVRPGKRRYEWSATLPAALFVTEALDGGDARRKAKLRDQLSVWEPPFSAESQQVLARTPWRIRGLDETPRGELLIEEYRCWGPPCFHIRRDMCMRRHEGSL